MKQDRFLPLAEVKSRTGVGRALIYELIAVGRFPGPVKIGRASRWVESEISAWMELRASERSPQKGA